jgi:hypothetical protein
MAADVQALSAILSRETLLARPQRKPLSTCPDHAPASVHFIAERMLSLSGVPSGSSENAALNRSPAFSVCPAAA